MVKGRWLTALKVLGGLIASLMVLIVGTVFLLNTDAFQNKLLKHATRLLSEKLQTSVEIDSVSIGLFSQDIRLYGLDVEDLQHRKMLQLDRLSVDVKWLPLLRNEVCINNASIDGVRAQLYKPRPDSAANFQFVIDAFKKDSTESRKQKPKEAQGEKKKLTLNLSKVSLSNIDVSFNTQTYSLQSLLYKREGSSKHTVTITDVQRTWVSHTKKGDVDNRLKIDHLFCWGDSTKGQAEIGGIHFITDNHQPRKNKGKPKRGAFDVGHFDIEAALTADIHHFLNDSIVATITKCHALDKGSGLELKSLQAKAQFVKGTGHLSDVAIQLPNSQLKIANATILLPSKKFDRPFKFSATPVTGRVILKDISRPFAPVLSGFTIPLMLRVDFSGDAEQLTFKNVSVTTQDKKLTISADGGITGLKDKHELNVHFHVNKMTAQGGIKERIISQFPVKKFMMKQLHNLGTIHYTGDFNVLWKKETFQGLLNTAGGHIKFNFALDELNKYVYGTARTDSFMLGRVMDMPDIGMIACKADFKFDISKPRTALMRKQKGGKLPIGQVNAEVYEAAYKKVKVRNIVANIKSDGAVAEGDLTMKGGRVDVLCSFSFTNTNEMKKTKIKPGIRFHKLSEEDKAARDERKQQKANEKALRKQQKADEKALRKQQKADEKALRKQQKADEKAAKKAAKAEAKAAKKAEKAARKAAQE